MTFVSVTRFRLRSLRFLPAFALHARRTIAQIEAAPGFLGGALLNDRRFALWTLTLWRDREAMRAYMTSGAHLRAMPKLLAWGDEASVVHWEQPGVAVPSWPEAARRMRDEGRPSKVRHPSAGHAELRFAEPRTTRGGPLRPRG